MIIHRIDAQSDDLAPTFLELTVKSRNRAEFSGADRGEVLRVGEQHRPSIFHLIVEPDTAGAGGRGEVGRWVVYP